MVSFLFTAAAVYFVERADVPRINCQSLFPTKSYIS